MIPGMKQHTRLAQLGLWTLEERRHRADLLEVFRMYKGLSLTPFCRVFTLSSVTNIIIIIIVIQDIYIAPFRHAPKALNTRGHSAKVLKNHCSVFIGFEAFLFLRASH